MIWKSNGWGWSSIRNNSACPSAFIWTSGKVRVILRKRASRLLPIQGRAMDILGAILSRTARLVVFLPLVFASITHLVLLVFRPTWARRIFGSWTWGIGPSGPPVSRIGLCAWSVAFIVFGGCAVLEGCGIHVRFSTGFPVFVAAFGLVGITGIYDSWKAKL